MYAGGAAGQIGKISGENSASYTSITTESAGGWCILGGFVSLVYEGTFQNVIANVSVTITQGHIGGIAGSSNALIIACYAGLDVITTVVSSNFRNTSLGSLSGIMMQSSVVCSCGSITVFGNAFVIAGGLMGRTYQVMSHYSFAVTNMEYRTSTGGTFGGFIGLSAGDQIQSCYVINNMSILALTSKISLRGFIGQLGNGTIA